jgi:hypothetical protein
LISGVCKCIDDQKLAANNFRTSEKDKLKVWVVQVVVQMEVFLRDAKITALAALMAAINLRYSIG